MATNEFVRLLDTLSEAWRQITEQMQVLANSLSKIFDSLEQTKNQTQNHYKPPKNQYLRNKTHNFYKVEPRVQRHLPYQRRIY